MLEHLQLLLQEQQEQLRKEDSRAQEQLRMWADAPEKPGKGGKDNNKEREKELNDKLSKVGLTHNYQVPSIVSAATVLRPCRST